MEQHQVDPLIEEHYDDYLKSVMGKTGLPREDAMELLHTWYINYMNPMFADGCKYGGPREDGELGQIRLWDQFIHMNCQKWKARRNARKRRQNLHS